MKENDDKDQSTNQNVEKREHRYLYIIKNKKKMFKQ